MMYVILFILGLVSGMLVTCLMAYYYDDLTVDIDISDKEE